MDTIIQPSPTMKLVDEGWAHKYDFTLLQGNENQKLTRYQACEINSQPNFFSFAQNVGFLIFRVTGMFAFIEDLNY